MDEQNELPEDLVEALAELWCQVFLTNLQLHPIDGETESLEAA